MGRASCFAKLDSECSRSVGHLLWSVSIKACYDSRKTLPIASLACGSVYLKYHTGLFFLPRLYLTVTIFMLTAALLWLVLIVWTSGCPFPCMLVAPVPVPALSEHALSSAL